MRFSAKYRLRTQSDYARVRTSHKRIVTEPFILQTLIRENDPDLTKRIGIIASKRVGKAPKRNYAKRIFRELFRKHYDKLPPCSDTVVVVRFRFNSISFEELEAQFLKAISSLSNA